MVVLMLQSRDAGVYVTKVNRNRRAWACFFCSFCRTFLTKLFVVPQSLWNSENFSKCKPFCAHARIRFEITVTIITAGAFVRTPNALHFANTPAGKGDAHFGNASLRTGPQRTQTRKLITTSLFEEDLTCLG